MAGEHRDAISRVNDLIATVHLNSTCYMVQARARRITTQANITANISPQAYMHLLLDNSHIDKSDFTAAVQSFERAQAKMRHQTSRTLFVVSLVSFPTHK